MSDAGYHRLARQRQERVVASADRLEFWVGVAAVLMLVRCDFLTTPADGEIPSSDDSAPDDSYDEQAAAPYTAQRTLSRIAWSTGRRASDAACA